MKYNLDFDEVLLRVETIGWDAVYSCVPELSHAIAANAKSKSRLVSCPKYGGGPKSTKFRLFEDWRRTGGGIHNDFGGFKGGAALLMWLRDWDYKTTLYFIAECIGMHVEQAPRTHKKYAEKRQDLGLYDPEETAQRNAAIGVVAKGVGNSMDYSSMSTAELQELRKQRETEETEKQAKEDERRRRSLKRLMSESYALTDSESEPARLYLKKRGINVKSLPLELRYHPNVAYYDEVEQKVTGFYPAILGIVRNSANLPVTLHRIYLDNEGNKADVPEVKKMMSAPSDKPMSGSAIRLSQLQEGKILHLAEGIETALAIQTKIDSSDNPGGHAVWATINSTLLEAVNLPNYVKQVVIWADLDLVNPKTGHAPGEWHAKALKARLWKQGIKVAIFMPKAIIPKGKKSVDWLDKLNEHGLDGIPDTNFIEFALSQLKPEIVEQGVA